MLFLPLLISFYNLLFGVTEVNILFVGDAMQHQAQIDAALQRDGSYSYDGIFAEIEPMLVKADFAVVNLETPLGDSHFSGYPCFNAPVDFAKALKNVGFNLMLTANNHTLDRRDRGLHKTLDLLDKNGIEHIGTYHDAHHHYESTPYIKEISGIKFAFLNYTYGTNGIKLQTDAVVNYIDTAAIAADIKECSKAGAEITTVCIHWGDEYKLHENKSQRQLADFLVRNGVDIIMGSHPHVVQPMEMRHNDVHDKDVVIVYSLGNFISNMKTRDTRGGAVVNVSIERGTDGVARLKKTSYDLVFTVPPTRKGENFKLVPARTYNGAWSHACRAFVNAALDVLNDPTGKIVPMSDN